MRLSLLLLLIPVIYAYYEDENTDYWYRCSSPSHTEMWITCNLKPVIENNVANATREIIQTIEDMVNTKLDQQEIILKRILAVVEGAAEVEKPIDCSGLGSTVGSPSSSVFIIYPTSCSQPVEVHCRDSGEGLPWTIFLERTSSGLDFNRSWEDYKQGFGQPEINHWLGLEFLHQLTKDQKYELEVSGSDNTGTYSNGTWGHFRVLGENTQYKLEIGDFRNNSHLKDNLKEFDKQKFSTFDRDNDAIGPYKCAKTGKGGWWYRSCGETNPTGPLEDTGRFDSAFWIGWNRRQNIQTTLANYRFAIRPKDKKPRLRKCYGREGLLEPFDFHL